MKFPRSYFEREVGVMLMINGFLVTIAIIVTIIFAALKYSHNLKIRFLSLKLVSKPQFPYNPFMSNTPKRVFLIDSMSHIFRVFFCSDEDEARAGVEFGIADYAIVFVYTVLGSHL
jgi:hypothetical protein